MRQPIHQTESDQFAPTDADWAEYMAFREVMDRAELLPQLRIYEPPTPLCGRCWAKMCRFGNEWICPDCVAFVPTLNIAN